MTALFGAGLTNNFGGFLSRDIWGQVLCHPRVRNHRDIRFGLLEHENHEQVLGDIRQQVVQGVVDPTVLTSLEDAIRDVFASMEDRITSSLQTTQPFEIQSFIRRFDSQAYDGASFVFTLNRDLLVVGGATHDRRLP